MRPDRKVQPLAAAARQQKQEQGRVWKDREEGRSPVQGADGEGD